MSTLHWDAVERLLADYYQAQGWEVDHCGTGAGGAGRFDGGIDLKLRKDDAYVLVQSKHWNAYQVPHNAVHELMGVMVNESATGAVLVTSGEFTAAARAAAQRLGHVQLVDGDLLREWLTPWLSQLSMPSPPLPSPASRRVETRRRSLQTVHPLALIAVLGILLLGFLLLMKSWMGPLTGLKRDRLFDAQNRIRQETMPVPAPRSAPRSTVDDPVPATGIDADAPGASGPQPRPRSRQQTPEEKRATDAIVEDIPKI